MGDMLGKLLQKIITREIIRMNAGIVSLYGYINYGNRLQSYAVQQVLKQIGIDSQVIYVQKKRTDLREAVKSVYFLPPVMAMIRPNRRTVLKYKRQKSFERFNKTFIHTHKYSNSHDIQGFDYYVLGSDQVWNPKRYDDVKKELFFLKFASPQQKVCFSPSFGVNELPAQWTEYFKQNLMDFPYLSVREDAGARIIKELTGRDAEVLIDPTLMIDADDWRSIASKPGTVNTECEYILNYFIGEKPEKAVIDAGNLYRKHRFSIYDLFDIDNEGLYTADPSEFLYLIDHASIVQTDSFHACVFAFLFGKPFLLYAREGKDADMLSRIETLFKKFDLMRKFIGSGLENDMFECNYESGYSRLAEEREKVYSFLKYTMNI